MKQDIQLLECVNLVNCENYPLLKSNEKKKNLYESQSSISSRIDPYKTTRQKRFDIEDMRIEDYRKTARRISKS